jgi:hypothetical protein
VDDKYMSKYSTSIAIKDLQIKMTLRFHPTNQNGYHQENRQQQMLGDVGKKESSYTVCGNAN